MNMHTDYMKAFVASVRITMRELLEVAAVNGEPMTLEGDCTEDGEIVAHVGIAAPFQGAATLCMPAKTALALTSHILGRNYGSVCSPVVSAVLATADQVCQELRSETCRLGLPPLSLGLPQASGSVQHTVAAGVDTVRIEVPFTSELGRFSLALAFWDKEDFCGLATAAAEPSWSEAVG